MTMAVRVPQWDWTIGEDGRANTSPAFERMVGAVAIMLKDHRIGDDPTRTARTIVAHLAHRYKLEPFVVKE
jgi:hypothetical protein